MITDKQIGWLREFLAALCSTDADRMNATELVETFRQLWKVARAAEFVIEKPPAQYEPGSRKAELKLALDILRQRNSEALGRPLGSALASKP